MKKFLVLGCRVLWRELCHYSSFTANQFDFRFFEKGLHNTPVLLRDTLQKAIDEAPDGYDAILLGYCLCSGGSEGLTARRVPLVLPRGHDCITVLLGSKERYREYFDAHPGTYWYSPGWIESGEQPGRELYEKLRQRNVELYGEENADTFAQMEWEASYSKYSTAAYVDLGFHDPAPWIEYTRKCAEHMGWKYERLRGEGRLLIDFTAGDWDDERFLVVPPGSKIAASYDEMVVKAAPAG